MQRIKLKKSHLCISLSHIQISTVVSLQRFVKGNLSQSSIKFIVGIFITFEWENIWSSFKQCQDMKVRIWKKWQMTLFLCGFHQNWDILQQICPKTKQAQFYIDHIFKAENHHQFQIKCQWFVTPGARLICYLQPDTVFSFKVCQIAIM